MQNLFTGVTLASYCNEHPFAYHFRTAHSDSTCTKLSLNSCVRNYNSPSVLSYHQIQVSPQQAASIDLLTYDLTAS